MYTQFNKAIVALIMAIIMIVQNRFHISLGIDEATLTSILAVLTPILVYFIPNIPKDK